METGTQLAREHPEFILPAKKAPGAGGLLNLGDPKARRWITDLLVRQIAEFNIHTYRNDFNMDPCRSGDRTTRRTAKESPKSAMWRDVRHVGRTAGSIRRCTWTTAPRAAGASTWKCSCGAWCRRGATSPAPGRLEAAQCQSYGLSLFLPLHATIGWDMDAYQCRSSATAGFCGEWDILDPRFPFDQGRAAIAEIKANRKYWYGDFYPLTPCAMADDAWIAWQLHRPDLDEGLVLAFRRKDCRKSSLGVKLRGLIVDISTGDFIDERRPRRRSSKRPAASWRRCDRASQAAEQHGDSLRPRHSQFSRRQVAAEVAKFRVRRPCPVRPRPRARITSGMGVRNNNWFHK